MKELYEHEGYEDLANAVVIVATTDYRRAYKKHKKGIEGASEIVKEIEAFFNSQWGDLLCNGKAKEILKRLQKEQEEKTKKPKRTVKITKVERYDVKQNY